MSELRTALGNSKVKMLLTSSIKSVEAVLFLAIGRKAKGEPVSMLGFETPVTAPTQGVEMLVAVEPAV